MILIVSIKAKSLWKASLYYAEFNCEGLAELEEAGSKRVKPGGLSHGSRFPGDADETEGVRLLAANPSLRQAPKRLHTQLWTHRWECPDIYHITFRPVTDLAISSHASH